MMSNIHKILTIAAVTLFLAQAGIAQADAVQCTTDQLTCDNRKIDVGETVRKFLDETGGRTVDDLVGLALERNGEIASMRKEAEAAEAMIRQARLRPNPSVEISGTRQIGGMDDSLMAEGALPIELFGRRGARIRVALREAEIRRVAVAERERQIAAEIRTKFGEALAAAIKLRFTAEMINAAVENYDLISATVREGRRAPLEQNLELVELNRLRAMFEVSKGKTEAAMFDLRTSIGLDSAEPLRLRGELDSSPEDLVGEAAAIANALQSRPDLVGARLVEALFTARIELARAESRPDAEVMAGYQRMRSGFPLQGVDESGTLRPIESTMNFFTFGIRFTLPVRNRNQGMIEAATLERDAAAKRREFGEIAVKNEIATAFVQYRAAARAMEIYRVGVRDQAAANLAVVRQTFELGSRTLFDYIAEQRRFIEIESAYIDARLETYLARVAIARSANLGDLKSK